MRDFSFGLAPDTVPHLYPKEEYNFFHSSTENKKYHHCYWNWKGSGFLKSTEYFSRNTCRQTRFSSSYPTVKRDS